MTDDDLKAFTPPNPYAKALEIRAASEHETPEEQLRAFAKRHEAERRREFEEQRIAMEAQWAATPEARLTAAQEAELESCTPPDPYSADIKALQTALKQGR